MIVSIYSYSYSCLLKYIYRLQLFNTNYKVIYNLIIIYINIIITGYEYSTLISIKCPYACV